MDKTEKKRAELISLKYELDEALAEYLEILEAGVRAGHLDAEDAGDDIEDMEKELREIKMKLAKL